MLSKKLNLTGVRFNRLVVIESTRKGGRTAWLCKCDCGNEKIVQTSHLRSGATQSCGCLQKERASSTNTVHGGTGTPLYHRWKQVNQRCNNPNNSRYADYGGRGITVCKDWEDFESFEKWSLRNGYTEDMTLDRVNNDCGYSPENCRWVSYKVNNRNRRTTVTLEGKPLGQIAEENEIPLSKVRYRYYRLLNLNEQPTVDKIVGWE